MCVTSIGFRNPSDAPGHKTSKNINLLDQYRLYSQGTRPQTLNNNKKKQQSAWCIRLVPRGPEFDPLLHVSVTISDETLSYGPALLVILKLHTIINTLS